MSRQRTAKEMCERALRAIGAFPVTQSAADGEQLREAMEWLDIIMAEKAGTTRIFSLIPSELSIEITNGTTDYNLNTALGADLPVERVQFPVLAWCEDAAGNRTPVEIVTYERFERAKTAQSPTAFGRPNMLHLDRLAPTPTIRFDQVPSAADTTTEYTVKIAVQTYAPNVAPSGVTGNQPSAAILTKFRQAWQRWLILQLSSDLGSGPIRKLPQASITNFDQKARLALTGLEAFENREHENSAPVSEPWGM